MPKENEYFHEKAGQQFDVPGKDPSQSIITVVAVLANSGHQVRIYLFILNISSLEMWQVGSYVLANKTRSHGKLQSCLNTSTLRHSLQGMHPCQYAFGCQTDKNE